MQSVDYSQGKNKSCCPRHRTGHRWTAEHFCTPRMGSRVAKSSPRLQHRWPGCTRCSSWTWSPSVSPQPGSGQSSCRWGRRCWRSGSQRWCSCSAYTAGSRSAQNPSTHPDWQKQPTEAVWGQRLGQPRPSSPRMCPPGALCSDLSSPRQWSQRGSQKILWRKSGNREQAGRRLSHGEEKLDSPEWAGQEMIHCL